MSKKALERALDAGLKRYPERIIGHTKSLLSPSELVDANIGKRIVFMDGYKQAEKDTIERACQLLYDYNKQMTEMFGAKAVLSCNQFTIDVERFRKTLIIEEE